MVKGSKFDFNARLEQMQQKGAITKKIAGLLTAFYKSYEEALLSTELPSHAAALFKKFLELIEEHAKNPPQFHPYHKRVRSPFDYYQFGIEFLRPLVDLEHSTLTGTEHLQEIDTLLKERCNVIFFANHQIEADPQAISLLLEKNFPKLAEELIFVAGERVITDPLAVPYSMGRDLLCIYSKRYIDHPPEEKERKQLHNQKTMQRMSELLSEGGKCIYVAPSGGRDRRNKEGTIEMAPFDEKSVEMFYLISRRAKRPTYFYPLALATYQVLPPPETIQVELGEFRSTKRGPIHMAVGEKIDMEHFPGSETRDKKMRRKQRADYIWNLVHKDYEKFPRSES